MDVEFDREPLYDPLRTQKLKVEITRVGETDKHRSQELLMHIIENLEAGVHENRSSLAALDRETCESLKAHEMHVPHINEERIRNLISGAFTTDAQARKEAAKRHYGPIFWKIITPAAATFGTGLGALIQAIFTHWRHVH